MTAPARWRGCRTLVLARATDRRVTRLPRAQTVAKPKATPKKAPAPKSAAKSAKKPAAKKPAAKKAPASPKPAGPRRSARQAGKPAK